MEAAQERMLRIALSLCAGVEPAAMRKLVRVLGSAQAVWTASTAQWRNVYHMHDQTVARLDHWRHAFRDDQVEQHLRQRGITCLLPGDSTWPTRLNDLEDAPQLLFTQGTPPEPLYEQFPVAVVGTRRASSYGLEATRWVAETLVRAGCEVVSGLALGIDGAAHKAALESAGRTVAVLACGVDVCYPSSHQALYENIRATGWLVSEYAPGSPVAKYRFPERNRLIAAFAHAVIVVQAGVKSGALRTVEAALEIGRDVYVVPGPITSVHFRGSHQLLQDGARILVDPVDFLTDYQMDPAPSVVTHVPLRWQSLYRCLDGQVTAAHLEQQLQMSATDVFAGLLELELSGWVERVAGGLYQRHGRA